MQVPIWLSVVLVAAILFLVLLVYSARMQRVSAVQVGGLQTLDGMFHTMEGLTGRYFVEGNSVELLPSP